MPKLIGSFQCSFILGRQSSNNILVAQEAVHTMRYKKGETGFTAIKVDFEKAYDRLNWSFIRETLLDAGLPKMLVDIIRWCITSTEMQLLWNGGTSDKFNPRGDPMSPYIFVLCIETFNFYGCLA